MHAGDDCRCSADPTPPSRNLPGFARDRDRQVLVGVWAVGPLASESLAMLKDTVAQFPTYTEGYLKALEQLDD